MKRVLVVSVIMVAMGAMSASAATSNGSLTVTGTVEGALNLTVESAGGTTGGLGTGAATSALGTINKYGLVPPTNFTIAKGASDWTLSSNVGVKVVKANLVSDDYTLTAELGSAPASGITWKLDGSAITNGSPSTLDSAATYASTETFSWDIVVTDAASAGSINNTINFLATSN